MVIIDDQPQMLGRFARNFESLGFRVTPIVISRGDIDACFHNGHINKAMLAREIAALSADPDAWSKLQQREALGHFEYGAKNKSELRELLSTLNPDVILSDERMRLERSSIASEEEMRADDNVLCGADVMAMSKDLLPKVPRAIHTMIYDAQIKPVPKSEILKATRQGHMLFAKDDYEDRQQPQCEQIAAWFKDKLAEKSRTGTSQKR